MFSLAQLLERLRLPDNDPRSLVVDPPPGNMEHGILDLHFSGQMLRFRRDSRDGEEIHGDAITLQPQEFALALTLEHVRMPLDLAGQLVGRSIWNRHGLQVMSANAIDPGFSGQITFELTNFALQAFVWIEDGAAG
jgi:deoxycytidine triphosphate deaminase